MPVIVTCPNPGCGKVSRAAEEMLGKTVKCKQCGVPWVLRATVDSRQDDTGGSKGSVSKFNSGSATGSGGNKRSGASVDLPAMFGRYRLTQLLGEGGMGAVYLAEDTDLGRTVALKLPKFGPDDPPQRVERFLREGRAAAAFQHPNICTLYDIGRLEGHPYLTMAYVEGRSLSELIDADAPLTLERTVDLTKKIASALHHAHSKGIVHRDLKPGNILLDKHDEPFVTDFGLAKRLDEGGGERITHSGAVIGTPTYMSPEQVRGEGETMGPATDIYSLGVMFFEMLTGRVPYKGSIGVIMGQILHAPVPTVKDARPDLPPWVDAVIRQAMSKDADDRFPTMQAFADALQSGTVSHKPLGLQIDPADVIEEEPVAVVTKSSGKIKLKPASKDSGDKSHREPKASKGDKKKSGSKKKSRTNWMPVYIGGGVGLVAVAGLVIALVLSGKGGSKAESTDIGSKPGGTVSVNADNNVAALLDDVVKARRWDSAAIRKLQATANSPVQQAAAEDLKLAESQKQDERVALGDAWWTASQQPGTTKQTRAALAARAAFHYQFGIDAVVGARRDTILGRAAAYYAPPDMADRNSSDKLPAPYKLKTETARSIHYKLGNVQLPCVIEVVGSMPQESNGDAWLSLMTRAASESETGVRVASSEIAQPVEVVDFEAEAKHTTIRPRSFNYRVLRGYGETNRVVWAIFPTANGMTSEVYLNGIFAGTAPVPLFDSTDRQFELRLRVTSLREGERPVATFDSVRVWGGTVKPLAERVADLIEKGQFPTK